MKNHKWLKIRYLCVLCTVNFHTNNRVRIENSNTEMFEHTEPNYPSFGVVRAQNCEIRPHGHPAKEFRFTADIHCADRNDTAGDDGRIPDGVADTSLEHLCLGLRIEDVTVPLAQVAIVTGIAENGGDTDVVLFNGREGIGERIAIENAGDCDVLVGTGWIVANRVHDCEDLAVFLCHDLRGAKIDRTLNEIKTASLDLGERDFGVGCDLEEREHDTFRLDDRDDIISFFQCCYRQSFLSLTSTVSFVIP